MYIFFFVFDERLRLQILWILISYNELQFINNTFDFFFNKKGHSILIPLLHQIKPLKITWLAKKILKRILKQK